MATELKCNPRKEEDFTQRGVMVALPSAVTAEYFSGLVVPQPCITEDPRNKK